MNQNKTTLFVIIAFTSLSLAASIWLNSSVKNQLAEFKGNDNDQSQISLISSRISEMEKSISNTQLKFSELQATQLKLSKIAATSAKDKSADDLSEYLLSANQAIYQIEDILNASGILAIATNDAIDSSVLTALYDDKLAEKKREAYRIEMKDLSKSQNKDDLSKFGQELTDLKQLASFQFGRRNQGNEEERKIAVAKLLEKFPNSYAAGQILAEQTMSATFRGNPEDALSYYQKLKSNDKYAEVVHNQMNVKVLPNIQYAMASKYIRDGDYEQAKSIISDMEKSPDEIIASGGPGRRNNRGENISVAQAIKNLRNSIEDQ